MLGGVFVAALAAQARIVQADAGWLVDGELFLNGDMQPHVQERVGFPRFGQPVAVFAGFGTGKQGVVFGMAQGDRHDELFRTLERFTAALFVPGAEINLAQRAPILAVEHRSDRCPKQAQYRRVLIQVVHTIERRNLTIAIEADHRQARIATLEEVEVAVAIAIEVRAAAHARK